LHLVKVDAFLLDTASKFALFSVSGLTDEKLIKKQTYTKTEAYNNIFYSILNISAKCHQFANKPCVCVLRVLCTSKSILIISRYTVSKLARFLRHNVSFCAYKSSLTWKPRGRMFVEELNELPVE